MTIVEVNALSPADFVETFGGLFEHSPWIAEAAGEQRPFPDFDAMLAGCADVLSASSEERQLALIQAHPELAGKAALDRTLTESSAAEQASAGLDRMTEIEFAEFHQLNGAYRARFGLPFIICVRLTNKAGILAAMRKRLENSRGAEFAEALAEINKIARLRLQERVS